MMEVEGNMLLPQFYNSSLALRFPMLRVQMFVWYKDFAGFQLSKGDLFLPHPISW